jgi:hypothetical protein
MGPSNLKVGHHQITQHNKDSTDVEDNCVIEKSILKRELCTICSFLGQSKSKIILPYNNNNKNQMVQLLLCVCVSMCYNSYSSPNLQGLPMVHPFICLI